jgi:hypothetical protein
LSLAFEKKKERNFRGPHLKRTLPSRSLKNAFGLGAHLFAPFWQAFCIVTLVNKTI